MPIVEIISRFQHIAIRWCLWLKLLQFLFFFLICWDFLYQTMDQTAHLADFGGIFNLFCCSIGHPISESMWIRKSFYICIVLIFWLPSCSVLTRSFKRYEAFCLRVFRNLLKIILLLRLNLILYPLFPLLWTRQCESSLITFHLPSIFQFRLLRILQVKKIRIQSPRPIQISFRFFHMRHKPPNLWKIINLLLFFSMSVGHRWTDQSL